MAWHGMGEPFRRWHGVGEPSRLTASRLPRYGSSGTAQMSTSRQSYRLGVRLSFGRLLGM